jgi:hypothetical protein
MSFYMLEDEHRVDRHLPFDILQVNAAREHDGLLCKSRIQTKNEKYWRSETTNVNHNVIVTFANV